MKPFEVEKILQTIRDQLEKQEKSFSKEKVVEFTKTSSKPYEQQVKARSRTRSDDFFP
jgi:hypothetical protein